MKSPTMGDQTDRPPVIDDGMLDPEASRTDFEHGMNYHAPLTRGLIAACCGAFVWQLTGGAIGDDQALVRQGALVTDGIMRGEVWRLVSSLFLHGGLDHLLGNMVALFILGIACEHAFASAWTAVIYFATGVAGGLVSSAMNPLPTVGASGAVFGLMGGLVAVFLRLRNTVAVRDRRIGAVVFLWAVWQMVLGFTDPLIANFAHIGGFAAGLLLGFVVPLRPRS